jgi:putative flavoprotein involved in K+ transport
MGCPVCRSRAGIFVPHQGPVAEYLLAYAARFDLPVRNGVRVDGLPKLGDRFVVTSGDHRFEADNVVGGRGRRPQSPAFRCSRPSSSPRSCWADALERIPEPITAARGRRSRCGRRQFGGEITSEVSRDHRTWLSGRDPGHEPVRAGSRPDRLVTPLMWFVAMHVLTVRTPSAGRYSGCFGQKASSWLASGAMDSGMWEDVTFWSCTALSIHVFTAVRSLA